MHFLQFSRRHITSSMFKIDKEELIQLGEYFWISIIEAVVANEGIIILMR